MSVRIIVGDVRERLAEPPDQSVHCCVTSPPYWGLRDYGVAGQLGLESTPAEYVEKMVAVFAEVKRVLRDDGTLWLNLGDSYATGAGAVGNRPGGGAQGDKWAGHDVRDRDAKRRQHGRPEENGRGDAQAVPGSPAVSGETLRSTVAVLPARHPIEKPSMITGSTPAVGAGLCGGERIAVCFEHSEPWCIHCCGKPGGYAKS